VQSAARNHTRTRTITVERSAYEREEPGDGLNERTRNSSINADKTRAEVERAEKVRRDELNANRRTVTLGTRNQNRLVLDSSCGCCCCCYGNCLATSNNTLFYVQLSVYDRMRSSIQFAVCACHAVKNAGVENAVSVCPSVRLSGCPSRSRIVSKRVNISSNVFQHRVATPF